MRTEARLRVPTSTWNAGAALDVYYQNQVLSSRLLWPLQAFCFNFGATHIIHHYVVRQPFYLRQLVAAAAHAEMLRQGVPRNDFGTIARNNRAGLGPEVAPADPGRGRSLGRCVP